MDEEKLKVLFNECLNLEKSHFSTAKSYSYGYLIGFRNSDPTEREKKKEEAFYNAGMAEAYRKITIKIDKLINENDDQTNENQHQS